jgi:Arc/MetJ-type ribon-helix-helix transcriptional regulator
VALILPAAPPKAADSGRKDGMIFCHTRRWNVPKSKVAISIEASTLEQLDTLVRKRIFPSRSTAFQEAIEEKLERMKGSRLARESAKLDPEFEKAMAEESLSGELSRWPEY